MLPRPAPRLSRHAAHPERRGVPWLLVLVALVATANVAAVILTLAGE